MNKTCQSRYSIGRASIALVFAMTSSVAILFTGCGGKASPEYQRTGWYESGENAPNLYPGRNFCTSDIDRYPDFGFVLHSVHEERAWTHDIEAHAVIRAIQLCRIQFSGSYHRGEITTYDGFKTHRSQWLPPGNKPEVRFTPKYVVIVVRNSYDCRIFAEYVGQPREQIPHEKLVYPYKVGYLLDAAIVFGQTPVDEKLLSSGYRDEHPIRVDLTADAPKHEEVYDIVAKYLDSRHTREGE